MNNLTKKTTRWLWLGGLLLLLLVSVSWLQISDYGYVLETGEVTLEGPSNEPANDPRVIEAYLGLGHKH